MKTNCTENNQDNAGQTTDDQPEAVRGDYTVCAGSPLLPPIKALPL